MTEIPDPANNPEVAGLQQQMQGAELLPEDQRHLIGLDLTVKRNARDGQPEYTEPGWKLTGVHQDEETGRAYAHVEKTVGDDAGGSKSIWLDSEAWAKSVLANNPPNDGLDEDTQPRNPLVEKFRADIESGNAKEILIDIGKVEEVGEAAVKDTVEVESQEAEIEPKQVDEPQPESQEPEKVDPSTAEIFSSPDKLVEVLNDQEANPDLRQNLKQIVSAWKEIEQIDATGKLWESVVKPQLVGLTKGAEGSAEMLSSALDISDRLQQGLQRLAGALDDRDMQGAVEIMQGMRIGQSIDDFAHFLPTALANDEFVSQISRFNMNTEEADNDIRRLERADRTVLTLDDAAKLVADVGPAAQNGAELEAIKSRVVAKADEAAQDQPEWRKRRDAISDVNMFARAGVNALPDNVSRIVNQLEAVRDEMRRGGRDSAEIRHTSAMIENLKEELDQSRKMALVAKSYAEEIK